jgi:uncharacterized protein (DUF305 family)
VRQQRLTQRQRQFQRPQQAGRNVRQRHDPAPPAGHSDGKDGEAHAGSTEVKQLANGIESAQGPEIKTMTGWLKALGQDAPSGSMSGMGGKGGSSPNDMPGMMSDTDMAKLGRATGATFDQMWLKGMIAHHEGAVEMANTEIAKGKNGDAIDLAKSIKAAQTKEIAKMKNMLGS